MYLVVTARKGISSYQLAKELGITQKSSWFMGMLLFVYWECCCYLGNGNAFVVCVLGMLFLFVFWECCYDLGSGNAAVVCVLRHSKHTNNNIFPNTQNSIPNAQKTTESPLPK
jgi:hypothetical protein